MGELVDATQGIWIEVDDLVAVRARLSALGDQRRRRQASRDGYILDEIKEPLAPPRKYEVI